MRFIKQYYNTLLTSPAQLNRFYHPDSTVTRGMEPSAQAAPSAFAVASAATNGEIDLSPGEKIRRAFFEWAGNGADPDATEGFSIDFDRGAIDAQESIGGDILLVVTGHMSLPGSTKETPFVHTFFLHNAAGPGRKAYAVKNDILRFLEAPVASEVEDVAEVEVEETLVAPPGMEAAVVEEPLAEEFVQELAPPAPTEAVPLEPGQYEPPADEEKAESEDGIEQPVQYHIVDVEPAAEEEKDGGETSSAGSDSTPAASPSSSDGKKKKKRNKRGGKSRSRSRSTSPKKDEGTPETPKTPSSWANLVASGGEGKSSEGKKGRRASPKATRGDKPPSSRASKPPQAPPSKEKASAAAASAAQSSRRDPNATLFIRNVPEKTDVADVRALFEQQGKILSITLNPNRGFAFVDFDSAAAVTTTMAEAESTLVKDPRTERKIESKFMLHGRVLEIEKKVVGRKPAEADRSKGQGGVGGGGGRRSYRSHSPKEGGTRYRGSRGSGSGGRGGGGGGGNR
ncbi:hypothetical protein ACHAXT_010071 [Thalassiosira profunda]